MSDASQPVTLAAEDASEVRAQMTAAGTSPAARVLVTEDRDARVYEATLDGVPAGVVYSRTGGRVTLLATSVFPQFRGQGIAAALLTRVLGSIREQGDTITVTCPFTARFLESHSEFADLIDSSLPGVPRRRH
ncbi:GNAT family N-acetyltransferase [Cellulosimicrobium sp. CpK407]|uniref:GNAT family N-acetyltransferase n=1 Tax=Cellulosimicrobium sp. CpK407 TaxID=3229847 RepID=UPI003F349F0E